MTAEMEEVQSTVREIVIHWNWGLIIGSCAVSLLGAFTSTQLMCQAKTSPRLSGVFLWTILGSLAFGFCSIWSLHEVAMLACELDLPIGIDVPLTVLSAVMAVSFTFAALSSDLLWEKYQRKRQRAAHKERKKASRNIQSIDHQTAGDTSTDHLLSGFRDNPHLEEGIEEDHDLDISTQSEYPHPTQRSTEDGFEHQSYPSRQAHDILQPASGFLLPKKSPESISNHHLDAVEGVEAERNDTASYLGSGSESTPSRRSSSFNSSTLSPFGLSNIVDIKSYRRNQNTARNAFVATGKMLQHGATRKNISKGFLWSLAITGMHYVGILALKIPGGFFTLRPVLVIMSALISWIACTVACILMSQMESYLSQQFLFSVVATTAVAAMHFTGMRAATFYSSIPPARERGYPPGLGIAIACIAIATCIAANALLAHSATVSRNKLAEIVHTRKKLWMAIAQKENAESAAAARAEFIASASHEIRTPLHHLQGYSDLLSRTEMSDEGRLLLCAIQRATKTLSMITNNVLDWSRLERGGETQSRPISLDIRTVCESIVTLLPNEDEDVDVELLVVVAPDVPHALFLDEIYTNRILMNLLSNAVKFTTSGYILLSVEMKEDTLVAVVRDTGIGIPASFLPQLFEPFKQAQTRGSSRGTGLGLSIIKQLLHKMQGTIEVESTYQEPGDIVPAETGSKFTIRIPVQKAQSVQDETSSERPRIAIFHEGSRKVLEGLSLAWEKFNYEVMIAKKFSDLRGFDPSYIWADLSFLQHDRTILKLLLDQKKWTVLVPCDTRAALQRIPEIAETSHFVPLIKPVLWHNFEKIIAQSSQKAKTREVRFAFQVDVLDGVDEPKVEELKEEQTSPPPVVLLVEDNPINVKLGKKMLTTLGYQVLIAEDGQEAIEQILKHDAIVDIILMDQNMPRKNGLVATREIREMEATGVLSRRRPIIAVTAVVGVQAEGECRAAGMDDFLPKPLSMSKLEQSLASHMMRK